MYFAGKQRILCHGGNEARQFDIQPFVLEKSFVNSDK